ncbi:MAG: hypothetical protein ACK5HU_01060 [Flavobacteriales bacterium]
MSDRDSKTNETSLISLKTGTFIIILSGVILYLDKIILLFIQDVESLMGYPNLSSFIWVLTQTLSPLILILGVYIKAYKWAYLVPIYCYCLQLFYILNSSWEGDDFLVYPLVGVLSSVIFLIFSKISTQVRKIKGKQEQIIEMYEILIEKK